MDNNLISSEYNFKNKSIPISEINLSSSKRCHTIRYYEALKIIENENIAQLEIKNALDFYFYQDRTVPLFDKHSIEEINYCPNSRIIQFRMRETVYTYENRIRFARVTGWYFYVTGTVIPQSEISKYVDTCSHRYSKEQLKWEIDSNVSLAISSITCFPNENSYLLQLGNRNILLDAGLPRDIIQSKNYIRSIKEKGDLDAIFISHAHDDHIRGLSDLITEFPNVPIILSATSLDFFILEQRRHYKKNDEEQSINNSIVEKQIINNSIVVKNKEKIYFNEKGYIQFFFAGHMPGALMLFLEFNEYRFLFTGDYSFHSYRPIPGIDLVINDIPSPIDFLLVDGAFSDVHYNTPSYQFNFLRDNITFNAHHKNNVLIGADSASLAIIIFSTLHFHFLSLKENERFELRPTFFLSDNVRKSVQILCSRLDDIHPVTADNIENEFNPFSSALIQWIRNKDDKLYLEEKLKERNWKNGNVVIFDPPDLKGWIVDFFKIIASDKNNAIYLAGALRNPTANELVSGRDDVVFQSQYKIEEFVNKGKILNRFNPDNILNLHADDYQLGKIIEILKPNQICFFQKDPKKLINVRNWIVKQYPFVAKTHAFYPEANNKILIQGSVKS